MSISKAQQTNLINATLNASGRGVCRYLSHAGEPQCVIAHLALSEGVSLERLNQWRGTVADLHDGNQSLAVPELGTYPMRLLNSLQDIWDDGSQFTIETQSRTALSEDEARVYMLFLIEADSE